MARGYTITISDQDGAMVDKPWFVREQHGADALADSIAKHVARYRGEIWAADKITISIVSEDRPELAELPEFDVGED